MGLVERGFLGTSDTPTLYLQNLYVRDLKIARTLESNLHGDLCSVCSVLDIGYAIVEQEALLSPRRPIVLRTT